MLKQKICFTILMAISFLLYPTLNKAPQEVHILELWIDSYIPFWPAFSIPYLLYIPYIIFTLLFFVYFSEFSVFVTISFVFCLLIASFFYVFFQTTVPRSTITSADLFSSLVNFIYAVDKPYNCFPSLHVSLSVMMYLYWLKRKTRNSILLGIFTLFIILSTLLIKQHFIADVIAGIALGILSYYIGSMKLKFPILFARK